MLGDEKCEGGNSVGHRKVRQKVVTEHYIARHCNLLTTLLSEPRVLGRTKNVADGIKTSRRRRTERSQGSRPP